MKLAAVTTQVVRQAQTGQAAAPAQEAEAPKESFLAKMARSESEPMTISRVAINTLKGAVGGAVCGHFISSSKGRSIGFNAAAGAAVGGGLLGLGGAFVGALAGDKAAKYGGTGLVVGAAAGGALGAVGGYADYLLNSALPWTPAINGAVLGAGAAVIGGIWTLATQKAPEQKAAA